MTLGNSPPPFHMRISTPTFASILTLTILFAIRADNVHGQPPSARPADAPAASSTQAPVAPAPPAPATQRDLTEGLLDLLQEPAKNNSDPKASHSGTKPSNTQEKPKSNQPAIESSQPASDSAKRTAGEDIGEPPLDPLTEVQLGMSTAAARLRTRTELVKTQGLQRDIVARLDDLIGQLEQRAESENDSSQNKSDQGNSDQNNSDQNKSDKSKSDPNNSGSNNSSSTPRNASNRLQSSAAPPKSLSPSANNQPPDRGSSDKSSADKSNSPSSQPSEGQSNNPSNDQEGSPDTIGQEGPVSQPGTGSKQARQIVVDLNDPAALQRSAWGNLPERVREQMQSRMVERFLPGYREEIEAYYRALAK